MSCLRVFGPPTCAPFQSQFHFKSLVSIKKLCLLCSTKECIRGCPSIALLLVVLPSKGVDTGVSQNDCPPGSDDVVSKPSQQYGNDNEDWNAVGDDNNSGGRASESFTSIRVSNIDCTHCLLPPLPLLLLPAVVGLTACRRRILLLALVHRHMLLSRRPPPAARTMPLPPSTYCPCHCCQNTLMMVTARH